MEKWSGMTVVFSAPWRAFPLAAVLATALTLGACGTEAPTGSEGAIGAEEDGPPRAVQVQFPDSLPQCPTIAAPPAATDTTPEPGGEDGETEGQQEAMQPTGPSEADEDLESLEFTLCSAAFNANKAVELQGEADKARATIFADGSTKGEIRKAVKSLKEVITADGA